MGNVETEIVCGHKRREALLNLEDACSKLVIDGVFRDVRILKSVSSDLSV